MSRTVLITGGNRGIGLELIRQFHENGGTVIVCCRQSSSDLEALDVRVITGVDVTDLDSIKNAKSQIGDVSIDILINNAGLLTQESIDDFDEAAIERINKQFQINSLGPLKVTSVFLDSLKQGSKIIMITSRMGSVVDNTSGSRYGYRMSKAALNMASKSLSVDMQDRGIAVGVLHPGWVQTEMTGNTGHLTAKESAALLRERIEDLSIGTSGTFFHANGEVLGW